MVRGLTLQRGRMQRTEYNKQPGGLLNRVQNPGKYIQGFDKITKT